MVVGASSAVAVSDEMDNMKVQLRRLNPYCVMMPWIKTGLGRIKASAARNPALLEGLGADNEIDGVCRAVFRLVGATGEISELVRLSENTGELGSREVVDWFSDAFPRPCDFREGSSLSSTE
jgi:hypothetical protein